MLGLVRLTRLLIPRLWTEPPVIGCTVLIVGLQPAAQSRFQWRLVMFRAHLLTVHAPSLAVPSHDHKYGTKLHCKCCCRSPPEYPHSSGGCNGSTWNRRRWILRLHPASTRLLTHPTALRTPAEVPCKNSKRSSVLGKSWNIWSHGPFFL